MRDRSTDTAVRRDFEEFVREHWSSLMSIATAVCGSRTEAEDLVQTALAAAYPRWRRIRRQQALAYVRRSILNANVSRWRRDRGSEIVMADVPDIHDRADPAARAVEERASLLPVLRTLPERQRAVLVLRYLCDLPDAEIARTLDISPVTVRTQALRGLATLRAEHGPPPQPAVALVPDPARTSTPNTSTPNTSTPNTSTPNEVLS